MTIAFGIDTYAPPPASALATLATLPSPPVKVLSPYLAPAPSHRSTGWKGKCAGLQKAGFTLAPVFVGAEVTGPGEPLRTAAQGAHHSLTAYQLLREEGLDPAKVPVFLDIENGGQWKTLQKNYVQEWCRCMLAMGARPGVYCSHTSVPALLDALQGQAVCLWVYQVPTVGRTLLQTTDIRHLVPASPGGGSPHATGWQFRQNVGWEVPGASVVADFSVWDTDFPALNAAPPQQAPKAGAEEQGHSHTAGEPESPPPG